MTKHEIPSYRLIVDSHCAECPVRDKAICTVFNPEISPMLTNSMVHKRFDKHEIIWGEGDASAYFAIVVSGAVKLVKTLPDGKQQIVGMLFASDCLGDLFVDEHTTYAEAVSETQLCCFPQKKFERALELDPHLEHALLEKTFQELVDARKWLATIGRLDAAERLASFLVAMMDKAARIRCRRLREGDKDPVFEIPMSRADIADYLGLTLETVSRQFSRLRDAGIISIHDVRTIQVHDPRALAAMSGN